MYTRESVLKGGVVREESWLVKRVCPRWVLFDFRGNVEVWKRTKWTDDRKTEETKC